MDWVEFVLALTVFLASHSIPVRFSIKSSLIKYIGKTGFAVVYSVLSLITLGWLILAAGRAPYIELWPWAPWQSQLTVVVMLLVCLLAALSIGQPNPFSFGGRGNEEFDPGRPGIVRFTRHPLLLVLAGWAIAHIVPNGNVAHFIMFGCFALFSLLGMKKIDGRKHYEMGESWSKITAEMKRLPLFRAPENLSLFLAKLTIGLMFYFGLIWLHGPLLGVSPLP